MMYKLGRSIGAGVIVVFELVMLLAVSGVVYRAISFLGHS